jgi:DNA-binding NarL/FixJ family response regulator
MLEMSLLGEASPETLRAFGEHHMRLGRELIARAEILEADRRTRAAHRDRMRARRALVLSCWDLVESHRATGLSFDAACAAAGRESGLAAREVAEIWRQANRRNHARARERRDVEIMRLRRLGLGDPEIGRQLGLHAKSVNRIIARQLDAARSTRRFMAGWRAAPTQDAAE